VGQARSSAEPRRGKSAPIFPGEGYRPAVFKSVASPRRAWSAPISQARGAEWVYDVFTPPEIYYDPRSKEFTVTPPRAPAAELPDDDGPAPAVRPTAFRLQLVGFVGGEGNYLGTFENLGTTEHILARGGRALPELGLTIRDFQVKSVRRESADSMAANELVATAVVRDERTGADVVLTNLERVYLRPGISP